MQQRDVQAALEAQRQRYEEQIRGLTDSDEDRESRLTLSDLHNREVNRLIGEAPEDARENLDGYRVDTSQQEHELGVAPDGYPENLHAEQEEAWARAAQGDLEAEDRIYELDEEIGDAQSRFVGRREAEMGGLDPDQLTEGELQKLQEYRYSEGLSPMEAAEKVRGERTMEHGTPELPDRPREGAVTRDEPLDGGELDSMKRDASTPRSLAETTRAMEAAETVETRDPAEVQRQEAEDRERREREEREREEDERER